MKHIYCISGFGADEKIFSKFEFNGYEIHFIKWITPEQNERIEMYAKRLIQQIGHKNPILIGLSFGGMMCIEIAKQIPVEIIIIISSIKSFHEKPYWMWLSGKLRLNKIFPLRSFRILEPLQNYNLGIKTQEEKQLVRAYRKNINQNYSTWAINIILNWRNDWKPANLFHIHGNKDRIFPIKKIKADYIIKGGGHLMVMNRASLVHEQISSILQKNM